MGKKRICRFEAPENARGDSRYLSHLGYNGEGAALPGKRGNFSFSVSSLQCSHILTKVRLLVFLMRRDAGYLIDRDKRS